MYDLTKIYLQLIFSLQLLFQFHQMDKKTILLQENKSDFDQDLSNKSSQNLITEGLTYLSKQWSCSGFTQSSLSVSNIQMPFIIRKDRRRYKLTESLPKNGKKYHLIIGPISTGKTSLLYEILKLKPDFFNGCQTQKAQVVASNENIEILDSPYYDDLLRFCDVDHLKLLHCVHRVFVAYSDSLVNVRHILEKLKIIIPNETYLVRTKCEIFQKIGFKELDKQIQEDRNYLEEVIKHKFPIFVTSACMGIDFGDNQHLNYFIRGMDY